MFQGAVPDKGDSNVNQIYMLPQDVVAALRVENTISGWLSSRKLVAPKRDNIQGVLGNITKLLHL